MEAQTVLCLYKYEAKYWQLHLTMTFLMVSQEKLVIRACFKFIAV